MGSIIENGRIKNHPILGLQPEGKDCTITVNSKKIIAREGEPILASLLSAGIYVVHISKKYSAPRGLYCGIGVCTDCLVTVNGTANVRSCVTPVSHGMVIETET